MVMPQDQLYSGKRALKTVQLFSAEIRKTSTSSVSSISASMPTSR